MQVTNAFKPSLLSTTKAIAIQEQKSWGQRMQAEQLAKQSTKPEKRSTAAASAAPQALLDTYA